MHRDISPQNIRMSWEGDVKVLERFAANRSLGAEVRAELAVHPDVRVRLVLARCCGGDDALRGLLLQDPVQQIREAVASAQEAAWAP